MICANSLALKGTLPTGPAISGRSALELPSKQRSEPRVTNSTAQSILPCEAGLQYSTLARMISLGPGYGRSGPQPSYPKDEHGSR